MKIYYLNKIMVRVCKFYVKGNDNSGWINNWYKIDC